MGFSTFELVYGRKISTPTALQRQSWENNDFVERTLKKPAEKYRHELSLKIRTKIGFVTFFTKSNFRLNVASTQFFKPFGTYHYNMMAQGLCGAQMTAQKLIDCLLRRCHRYSAALQDDIILFPRGLAWPSESSGLAESWK